jgi:hypothetical protein
VSETTTVTYRGPSAFASALAQMLQEEGVRVDYAPPPEERSGLGMVAGAIVLNIVCSGTYDAIKASIRRFKESRFGPTADVEIPDDPLGNQE